jgi:hypothetical protein
MKKAALMLVAFLSLAAVIGFVVTRPRGAAELSVGGGSATAPAADATTVPSLQDQALVAVGAESAAPAVMTNAVVSEIPGLPPLGQAVVKTADISVVVRKGGFGDAFDTASMVAGRYGGYVESSSMSGTQAKSGDLIVRVPSAHFDDAMADLRDLGTVEHQAISGQVVTQNFIDLEARLRTWEAQEAVLIGLMDQATSLDATLRIQRELQDVQFRIEQIKGQLRVLEDQTALATIRVSLRESGAPTVLDQQAGARPSLAEAWSKAVDGVLGVAYVTIVGLGYVVPITLLALMAWVAYRKVTRSEEARPTAA